MDKQRPAPGKARVKSRGLPPPGDFIALGSKNRNMSDPDLRSAPSTAGQPRKPAIGQSSGPSSLSVIYPRDKRKDPGISSLAIHQPQSKQAKLMQAGFLGRARDSSEARSKSPIVLTPVEDSNIHEEMDEVTTQFDIMLTSCIKSMKINKLKPDAGLYLSVLSFAKENPAVISSSNKITEKLLSCLRRDNASATLKPKPNPMLCILASNVLFMTYDSIQQWPDSFIKVYVEDALGERIWVDNEMNKAFVDNIITAFGTVLLPKTQVPVGAVGDEKLKQILLSEGNFTDQDLKGKLSADDLVKIGTVANAIGQSFHERTIERYRLPQLELSIQYYILDVVKDQLSKRQMIDSVSRNLLRFLSSVCGYPEVRVLATQRIETWLQNPKLTRPAQELLMSVALNCNTHSAEDIEVIGCLIKMRLKTKPLANLYISSIREMLNQHPENLGTTLRHVIYNELSQQRNPNNMTVLGVIFQVEPDTAAQYLASVFQSLMTNREDYLRALRALFREICRSMRYEMKFVSFCRGLMQEPTDPSFRELETTLKDRMLYNLVDLICMAVYVSGSPAVKEVATALSKGESRDVTPLQVFQNQVSEIQRDAVWWFHTKLVTTYECSEKDFFQLLSKILFLDNPDTYQGKDNWPPESDKQLLYNLSQDAPLSEDMLLRFVILGLTDEFPLNSADTLDMVERLVQRSAMLKTCESGLSVSKLDIIDMILTLALYSHPKEIALPAGYSAPSLAISKLHWKALSVLLILACCNPESIGIAVWESQPTLRCMMEMIITGNYDFPPLERGGRTRDEVKSTEFQIKRAEKDEIILFETHLAAATSGTSITESNSLLANQLFNLETGVNARQPPHHIIETMKKLNKSIGLSYMLCRCRDPDFLLMIIESQDSSESIPWLADLVRSSEGSLNVLPVQCLCEFLLMEDTASVTDTIRHSGKKKRDIRKDVVKRLQSVLIGPDASEHGTAEMIGYFLSRLGSSKLIERRAAVLSLSLLLDDLLESNIKTEEMDVDTLSDEQMKTEPNPMMTSDNNSHSNKKQKLTVFSGYTWLFNTLPHLGYFDSIMPLILSAVQQAFYYEVDVQRLQAYISFTSKHIGSLTDLELRGFTEDLSILVTTRSTILECLVTQENDKMGFVTVEAMLSIFSTYFANQLVCGDDGTDLGDDYVRINQKANDSNEKTGCCLLKVIHAAIVLLASCPFEELLASNDASNLVNLIFPTNGTFDAVTISTDEPVNLLPDWLRGTMLTSSLDCLTSAALETATSTQLIIFIQMFGLPITSVCKLLNLLDKHAIESSEALSDSIVNRDQLIGLLDVQWSRGATGGLAFANLLKEGYAPSSSGKCIDIDELEDVLHPVTIDTSELDSMEVDKEQDHHFDEGKVESTINKIFIEQNYKDDNERQRSMKLFNKVTLSSSISLFEKVTQELSMHLSKINRSRCINGLRANVEALTVLLQCYKVIKMKDENMVSTNMNTILKTLSSLSIEDPQLKSEMKDVLPKHVRVSSSVSSSGLSFFEIVTRAINHLAKLRYDQEGIRTLMRLMKSLRKVQGVSYFDPLRLDAGKCIKVCEWASHQDSLLFGRLVNELCGLFTRDNPSLTLYRKRAITKGCVEFLCTLGRSEVLHNSSLCTGMIVDWLELLDPEIVTIHPIMERRLLFSCKPSTLSLDLSSTKQQSFAYLRSIFAHQSSSRSVQDTLEWSMSLDLKNARIDATSILDFITTTVDNPRLWQGRDIKQNAFDSDRGLRIPDEVILNLNTEQLSSIARLIAMEIQSCSKIEKDSTKELRNERRKRIAEHRVDLLINHAPSHIIKKLPSILKSLDRDKFFDPEVINCLYHHLYMSSPLTISMEHFDGTAAEDIIKGKKCKLDKIVFDAISSICNPDNTSLFEERYQRDNILLQKSASTHPLLLLRHIAVFASLLSGRHRLSTREFRQTNQLLCYSSLITVLDALRPHIFNGMQMIRNGLRDSVSVMLALLKSTCLLRMHNEALMTKLVTFLAQSIDGCGTQWTRSVLLSSAGFFQDYLAECPDICGLRQLCSLITIPERPINDTISSSSSVFDVITISNDHTSFWSEMELQGLNDKITVSALDSDVLAALSDIDEMSKRQSDVLTKFFSSLIISVNSSNDAIQSAAFHLALRHCRLKPQKTPQLLSASIENLSSSNKEIVQSTVRMLPSLIPLIDDHLRKNVISKLFQIATTNTDFDVLPSLQQSM